MGSFLDKLWTLSTCIQTSRAYRWQDELHNYLVKNTEDYIAGTSAPLSHLHPLSWLWRNLHVDRSKDEWNTTMAIVCREMMLTLYSLFFSTFLQALNWTKFISEPKNCSLFCRVHWDDCDRVLKTMVCKIPTQPTNSGLPGWPFRCQK